MQESINNQSMLKVGTILHGTYRIDSYLSSGGFGNTYVATNVEFEERVAIKEFFMKGVTQRDDNQTTVSVSNLENTNSFQEQKEKFKKEARRLRKMQNEHLVRVHDLFDENGTTYYVMDYVDGENLSEWLKRTGRPMTESEVRLILPQILDALKAVHNEGFCHLDIKPSNIMLEKGGKIKLIDFGASKQLGANGTLTTNAPTAFAQTPGYAPREQMEQNLDKIGPWTDIYALGATLYNLLTNKRPPMPTDIDDDMSEDKHVALPFPESVGGMKYLVLQMMKTNRLQRPQSIDAIINAEKTRKEEPKQAPKQQPTSQKAAVYDDEATIIAEPKYKKEEIKVESKVKTQPSTKSLNNNSRTIEDNKGFRHWSPLGVIVLIVLAVVLWSNYSHDSKTDTSGTEVIAIEAEEKAKAKDVMFDQSQIETSILVHLDSLAAELGKMPFFLSNIHKNTDISVYDISVESKNSDMYKLRLIGAIDVNKIVAKKIGVPTNVFDNKLAILINDINYTPLKDYYQRGMISDLSYSLYTKMKADGKINYYWQIAAATIVEKLYLVSQNPSIISKNMNDWDVAGLTFCLVLVLDAIDRLSLYDTELEKIAHAITPLDIINATSQSELVAQIRQTKEDINSARNIILGK